MCPDSLKETTVILQNAAAVQDHWPNRCRTSDSGAETTIGVTSFSSSWRAWAALSAWETCGAFRIIVTRAVEVSGDQDFCLYRL